MDSKLVAAIEEQKSLMISVATGERPIKDVNEEYKKRRGEIGGMLKGKGIKDPNPFFDLWGWFKRFKSGDLPTYASRRQFMSELYDPLLEQLQQDGPSPEFEPTGWARVDRTVTEIRQRLEQVGTEEQFQAVGTLCRDALISLGQAVFDPTRHPTLDGVKASSTDFKRMIEAYIAVELGGASNEASRKHARAAFDLANDLQHKRTADYRHAALCVEATVAVINLIAIVSGQRDPTPPAAAATGEIKPKRGPELFSLRPRICSVEEYQGGVREGGDSFYPRAIVATFRMKTPASDDDEANITARLTYRTVTDLSFRQVSNEIHRVNYAMWLNEDFNSVNMGIVDTKEVLLLVSKDGRCVALQDNRRSVARNDPTSVFEFSSTLESMLVDVTLVDEVHGPIITYTYELKTKPLAVAEIIRGG
jgi:hypothetical protein